MLTAWSAHASASVPPIEGLSARIPLHGAVNAMGEHCHAFERGGTIEFRFTSARPVDFNVHYHTDQDTHYPMELSGLTSHEARFEAEPGRAYCFMWVNREYSVDEWEVDLEYRLDVVGTSS